MSSLQNDNPFHGMKIKDWSVLQELEGRAPCPTCKKSRKYFCYTCYVPIPALEAHVPRVKLPLKIDIIKHANEIDGKSTAAHAAVIAPDDVTIYTYPCIPDYTTEENVVLIFPGKNALSIQEYVDKHSSATKVHDEDECSEPLAKKANVSFDVPISRAVFIDSTWNQSRGIYKDPRLREIPCVVIQSRISQFWRHQHGSPRWFLATIEAVHQFVVELHIICKLGTNGEEESQSYTKTRDAEANTSVSIEGYLKGSGKDVIEKSTSHSCVEPSPVVSCPEEAEEKCSEPMFTPQEKTISNLDQEPSKKLSLPDKQPSKFVKNLALCRGIRTDPGGDPGVSLCGPEQWQGKYSGDYDNLLFFFQFMYHKIHTIYDHDKLRSYQRDMV